MNKVVEKLETTAGDVERVNIHGQIWVRIGTIKNPMAVEQLLAEKFHEGFRKEILSPEWKNVGEGWRFGVLQGIRAMIQEINKLATDT